MIPHTWVPRHPPTDPPPPALSGWAGSLGISVFLATLLWQRGLRSQEDMALFLNPGLRYLSPLENWPGLFAAASILAQAVLDGEKIAVWGDYDVDGITATALVADFFRQHNVEVLTHIPNRLQAGYGLNIPDLQILAGQGARLILTVDCGISNHEEVKAAHSLGLRVIISDHHLPPFPLPEAEAICSPTIAASPCPHLSGVGTAFMLMAGVGRLLAEQGLPRLDIRSLLDFVALGTLADVSDLSGQNRILVKNGLLALAEAKRPGLAALKNVCNYAPNAPLGAGQVVFNLCPRINAAGRLGKNETALRLLLTQNREEAAELAKELDGLNRERRGAEEQIQNAAREQALKQTASGRLGLVLYQPDWHMGIIGIVASRISEEFHRPTIILCDNGPKLKGSGRSVGDFDLYAALAESSSLFADFGGHKMAAGISLNPDRLKEFQEAFDHTVKDRLGGTTAAKKIAIDGEPGLAESTNLTTLKELELLQPFGIGNHEPVFASPPVILRAVSSRSSLSILDILDEQSGLTLKGKIWRQTFSQEDRGRKLRLAYSPRLNRYNGIASVELGIHDWKWM
ncbi:MAG: single-stranded-DNA-specific exonuclease RecJ [Desulfovibrionaceae bacterium]|nr:single-stranded-DNA-specific exonuclease RecJ [Desulfovibrionaceae bacterium]